MWEVALLSRSQGLSGVVVVVVVMVVSRRIWSLGIEPVGRSFQDHFRLLRSSSPSPGLATDWMATMGPTAGVFCTMAKTGAANEGLACVLCAEPPTRPRETLTMWSRTLLKSSRKMVSDAHLKTRASYTRESALRIVFHSQCGLSIAYPPVRIDPATSRHVGNSDDDIHDEEDEG